MKKFISFLIFFSVFSLSKAEWFDINSYRKVLAMSKMCRIGKISVFIISTKTCPPCLVLKKSLKEDIKAKKLSLDSIDFYNIILDEGARSVSEFEKDSATLMWAAYEGITGFPTVFIFSPTTNMVAKFCADETAKEGKTMYQKTVEIINDLQSKKRFFSSKFIVKQQNPVVEIDSVAFFKKKEKDLNAKMSKLQNDSLLKQKRIDTLEAKIKILSNHLLVDTCKYNVEIKYFDKTENKFQIFHKVGNLGEKVCDIAKYHNVSFSTLKSLNPIDLGKIKDSSSVVKNVDLMIKVVKKSQTKPSQPFKKPQK